MEPICTVEVQDVDNNNNEASEIIEDCLRNVLVVRKIMKNFCNPQLRKLSFVNKLWNYEARCVLKKRGNVVARLERNGLCHDIQAFAASLRQIKIVPFCGIRLVLPEMNPCECVTSALGLKNDIIAFDPLPFKTLSVESAAGKRWNPGCLLAKRVLRHVSGVLEELTFQMPFAAEMFIYNYVQECSFPSLRILKLKETRRRHVTGEDYVDYVKVLIARAPNLKELHSDRPLLDLLDLVEGSPVVPVCSYQICAPFDEITDDVMNSALRLETMGLFCTTPGLRFDFHRFHRILPMLLQSSPTRTLHDVTVDAVLAVPLMCYGIRLENVRKLTMGINYCELKLRNQGRTLRFLKGCDFTRIFPNLTKVHITNGGLPEPLPVGLETFIREANLSQPMPHRAANIKELHFHDIVLGNDTAQFFVKMFPDTERLYVRSFDGEYIFTLGWICEHWINLKELHIKPKFVQDTVNFDSVFCGIFFDEVLELMQKDDTYLKRVSIVPVKPSFACLRNLRVLNVEYDLKIRPDPIIYDASNAMFFLSKITGFIALARCPNLAVNLKIPPDGAHAVKPKDMNQLRRLPNHHYWQPKEKSKRNE